MERVIIVKVVGAATKAAIAEVLVTAYSRQSSATTPPQRLGSGLTNERGIAEIAYQIDEPVAEWLRIGVIITAPEGTEPTGAPLYQTAEQAERVNLGTRETFLVRLAEESLREAGVEVPPAGPEILANASTVVHRLRASMSQQSLIESEAKAVSAEHVGRVRTEMHQLEAAIRTQLRTRTRSEDDGGVIIEAARITDEQDSIIAATRQTIEQGLDRHFRDATRSGLLHLPPAEAEKVAATELPSSNIEALLFGASLGEGTAISLVRDDPLLVACRASMSPPCADAPADDNGSTEPAPDGDESRMPTTNVRPTGGPVHPGSGGPETPDETDREALLRRVRELIGTGTPGDGEPGTRPDLDEIESTIAGFRLRSSPADVTAVFDYDTLHIAFEHVWRGVR